MNDAQPKLGAILGTSRSGSTWLGCIIASHPDVAYRFEPLHRLRGVDETVMEARRRLESDEFSAADATFLRRALLPADPRVEKPPFFRKRYPVRWRAGRALLWPGARRFGAAAGLFRWLYSPRNEPMVVFKEVNYERVISRLLAAGVPVVYLIRHPCAVAWSHLRGQERGIMTDTRERYLADTLRALGGDLAARFAQRVDDTSKAQRRGLLWRISTDMALAHADHERFLLLVYEQLCADPAAEAERALVHFGLDATEEVRAFLRLSRTPSRLAALKHGEFSRNGYFSVFRDPSASMDNWRERMPEEAQRDVLSVVEDAPAFALFRREAQVA